MTKIGKLYGVGVGPGDPELLTMKAMRILREAHRVVAPVSSDSAEGRAESIVRRAIPDVTIERVLISMSPQPVQGRDSAPTGGTSADQGGGTDGYHSKDSGYERAARAITTWLEAGEDVAFVTLGDPHIYSTFTSIAAAVIRMLPVVEIETVEGIMAFQSLAARTSTTVCDAEESLTLVTAIRDTSALERHLTDGTTAIVVYKGGSRLPEIASLLRDTGRSKGAVAGELIGLAGERVTSLDNDEELPSSYLSTVLIPSRSMTKTVEAGEGPA